VFPSDWDKKIQYVQQNCVKVNEIMRHNVDKVALTARWLVIHTTIGIYTIRHTKYVFGVYLCAFMFIFSYLCT